jgi:hypothetical protein
MNKPAPYISAGRPINYTPSENGLFDVVQCLGSENVMKFLLKDKKVRVNTPADLCAGGRWFVSRSSLYRLRHQLNRLKRQEEAENLSSDEEIDELVVDDEAAAASHHQLATSSNNCSSDSNNESLLSANADDATAVDMESDCDVHHNQTDDPDEEVNDPDDDDSDDEEVDEPDDDDPEDEEVDEAAAEQRNVDLKGQILQLLEQQTRREREADNDSSSESVYFNSDDDKKSTTNHSAAKNNLKRNARPIIVAEFEAGKSNNVIVIDEDESSNDEQTLPIIVPSNEMIGNNQYTADDLFTDNPINVPAAADDSSVNNGGLLEAEKRRGQKKSMQTLLKLQTEARMKFIKQQDCRGNATWTNVVKHLGNMLDITQADMTVIVQLLKASELDPALKSLPETGKSLLEPKRHLMKKARKEFECVYYLSSSIIS